MTETRSRTQVLQESFIAAYIESKCNVSVACEKINISRNTYYRWLAGPKFRMKLDNAQEGLIDFVESRLMEKIDNGNLYATTFFLKTKGSKRGWMERQEHTIEHKGSTGITIEDFKLINDKIKNRES